VVLFSGTVRDNVEGRSDVEALTYEAFEERVVTVFSDIARETRHRWPDVGRIALLHRLGRLQLGESSVLEWCLRRTDQKLLRLRGTPSMR
jgi:molybdopterin synthase catalytic subunit